ncbi:MAG: hypothetical protein HZB72_15430 [Burkholderiales bacterium]|nr:hypothetical protein [Burkholderiales bacterium]
MNDGRTKSAELVSALGAGVLGAGLGLLAPERLKNHAAVLLLLGIVVHRVGMTLKYRLERRASPSLWWERALFWLCWASLLVLAGWLAAVALR